MIKLKRKKGFTMIEMLIAVTIMGILSTMMIVKYGDYVTRTEKAAAEHELMQIISVIDTAIATGNAYTDGTKEKRVHSYDDITTLEIFTSIYETETGQDISSFVNFYPVKKVLRYSNNEYDVDYDFNQRMIIYDFDPSGE